MPPEEQVLSGCYLVSMNRSETGSVRADMTSQMEFEAAITQMERYPPSIRDINGWNDFSLECVMFALHAIDAVKRGQAMANLRERERVIHFQRISNAAALYAKTLVV